MRRAIVVFQRDGLHPLGWLLHLEFRHCFVCVDDGLYWTLIDGADGLVVVKMAAYSGYDLAAFYRNEGFTVVEAKQGPGWRGPFALVNCVSLVKCILGIRAWVFTPYQLYRYLQR